MPLQTCTAMPAELNNRKETIKTRGAQTPLFTLAKKDQRFSCV